MNSTLKKVLSYIAVAFLGFASGVGCLIGVSSCSSSNGNDQQEKQQLKSSPKGRKITPGLNGESRDTSTDFVSDKVYYLVVKNYENQGKGYLWDGDSISIDNSSSFSTSSNYYDQQMVASFDFITNNGLRENYFFAMSPVNINGSAKLRALSVHNVGFSVNNIIYNAYSNIFNRQFCAFTVTNFQYITPDGDTNIGYFYYNLNRWFDVYELSTWSVSYDFNNYFNYNNFAQRPNQNYLNRALFPISGMISSSSANNTFIYDLPWFSSGDLVFNQIKVVFGLDLGYTFQNSNDEWVTYEQPVVDNYNTYFGSMSYVNTATNYEQLVCNRVSYSTGTGYSATHIFYNPTWTSSDYKTIYLQDEISVLRSKDVLSGVVVEDINAIVTRQNTDVGLGNVFSLISLAFASWVPILQIQIVPGVTIGLLLFLPLISGIIILVIWIVKR